MNKPEYSVHGALFGVLFAVDCGLNMLAKQQRVQLMIVNV